MISHTSEFFFCKFFGMVFFMVLCSTLNFVSGVCVALSLREIELTEGDVASAATANSADHRRHRSALVAPMAAAHARRHNEEARRTGTRRRAAP